MDAKPPELDGGSALLASVVPDPVAEASPGLRRVLFVDDEPSLLSALRRLLYGQRSRWAMTFESGGEAALETMQNEPFDVIVTDMQMPGMDGAALLHQVHRLYPQTVLLVLSGHADQSAVLSATQLAHRILRKPCEPAALIEAIDSADRWRVSQKPSGARPVAPSGRAPSSAGPSM